MGVIRDQTIASTYQRLILKDEDNNIGAGTDTISIEVQKTDVDATLGDVATSALYISTNRVGINAASPGVSLDITATDAIKLPVGTTAQKPAATAGNIRFNSETLVFEGADGSNWKGLGGAMDSDGDTYITADLTADERGLLTRRLDLKSQSLVPVNKDGFVVPNGRGLELRNQLDNFDANSNALTNEKSALLKYLDCRKVS